jgi:hypothetical protein
MSDGTRFILVYESSRSVRTGRDIRQLDRSVYEEVQSEAQTGKLRHSRFLGVRTDKPAGEVVREMS